jgi:hypothetical protein
MNLHEIRSYKQAHKITCARISQFYYVLSRPLTIKELQPDMLTVCLILFHMKFQCVYNLKIKQRMF